MDDKITELVQKLYNEDGHTGNVYKKATVSLVCYYEEKAQEIIEKEQSKPVTRPLSDPEVNLFVDLIVYAANNDRVKKELEPNIMNPMDIQPWMVKRVLVARQIVIEASKNEQTVPRANKKAHQRE